MNYSDPRHPGPAPGMVATVYAVLFLAGLYQVLPLGGRPGFPTPGAPLNALAAFFQTNGAPVRLLGGLQFAAAVPLGIFSATIVSRLRFHGIRAAGAYIALFGGLAAALHMMAAG